MWAPSGTSGGGSGQGPRSAWASARVATGPTQTSSSSNSASHRGERALREAARELLAQRLLPRAVLAFGELRVAEKLADPGEEDGLEGGERQVASVGGRVGRVAGEAAREEARQRVSSEPVGDQLVCAVRHRDDESRTPSGALAGDQCREHLRDRAEGAGEVRRLYRGRRRRRVLRTPAQPEEQVVSDTRRMGALRPEPGDRAVDDRLRDVGRPDPETLRDSGPKAFEHDVRLGAERSGERRVALQVADDGLLAAAERLVPRGRRAAHRVALGRLHPDDPRTEAKELPTRERPRQVAGEVDDEHPGERLLRAVWLAPILTGR